MESYNFYQAFILYFEGIRTFLRGYNIISKLVVDGNGRQTRTRYLGDCWNYKRDAIKIVSGHTRAPVKGNQCLRLDVVESEQMAVEIVVDIGQEFE